MKPVLIAIGAMVLAVFVAILVVRSTLNHPTPTPSERADHKNIKPGESNKKAKSYTGESSDSPVFMKVVPADTGPDDEHHKTYEQKEKPTLDRWLTYGTVALAVFTLFLFGGTVALAVYTYRLWNDACTTANNNATATANALTVAKNSADAAKQSADLARDEFIASHRPKIRIKHLWLTGQGDPHTPDGIAFAFVNKGSTTATIIEISVNMLALKHSDKLPQIPVFPHRINDFDPPHDELASGVTSYYPKIITGPGLSDADFIEVGMNRKTMYCYGYVEYKDGRDNFRKTAFCRKLERAGNDADHREYGRWGKLDDPDYEYQD